MPLWAAGQPLQPACHHGHDAGIRLVALSNLAQKSGLSPAEASQQILVNNREHHATGSKMARVVEFTEGNARWNGWQLACDALSAEIMRSHVKLQLAAGRCGSFLPAALVRGRCCSVLD